MRPSGWTNWAGNQHSPEEVWTPATLPELQDHVKRAAVAGGRLRAVGGGYSWSPLVPGARRILSMQGLDRLLDFDEEAGVIEVECGMTVGQLDAHARSRGFTLVSPTLFPLPTVGGALSTGCHGTSFRSGCFAESVAELTLVRYDGERRTLRRGDPDFPAAQVALGSLGIVYSAKLELERQFNVYVDKRRVPVHYVLEEFADLQRSYEFLEIFWFPLQSQMWLYLMERTPSPPDRKTCRTKLRRRVDTWLEETAGGRVLPWLASHMPRATPLVNRLASRLASEVAQSVQTASDAFHFQQAYPKNWDMSYAVPAESAARAWSEAIGLVNEYARAHLYPVNLAFHCRFTAGSRAWLAPDHGRPTCHIEVATAQATPEWRRFFHELEARWFAIDGARPHWGKLFETARELRGRYPRMQEFLRVRDSWDPDRVFLNRFLEEEVFQLEPREAPRLRPTDRAERELPAGAEFRSPR
jgi:L-gulonolactone oxidase